MEESKLIRKLLFIGVFILSLFAMGCFLITAATNQMVRGTVHHPNVTIAENYGNIQFGLIWGTKQYSYGFGERDEQKYIVYDEYDGEHNTGLIITTLCFVGVAWIFTFISVMFALMNWITTPSTDLFGIQGLFIWNGIAAGSGSLAIIFYLSLFMAQIRWDIQSSDEVGFQIEGGKARVGYSFWLLLVGEALVMTNILLVYLAKRVKDDPDFFKRKAAVGPLDDTLIQKEVEDAMNF